MVDRVEVVVQHQAVQQVRDLVVKVHLVKEILVALEEQRQPMQVEEEQAQELLV